MTVAQTDLKDPNRAPENFDMLPFSWKPFLLHNFLKRILELLP